MPWSEIVGVTGDERDDGLNQPATAIAYYPLLNDTYRWRSMAYAVRSNRVGTPGFLPRFSNDSQAAKMASLDTSIFAFPTDLHDEGTEAVLDNVQHRAGLIEAEPQVRPPQLGQLSRQPQLVQPQGQVPARREDRVDFSRKVRQ